MGDALAGPPLGVVVSAVMDAAYEELLESRRKCERLSDADRRAELGAWAERQRHRVLQLLAALDWAQRESAFVRGVDEAVARPARERLGAVRAVAAEARVAASVFELSRPPLSAPKHDVATAVRALLTGKTGSFPGIVAAALEKPRGDAAAPVSTNASGDANANATEGDPSQLKRKDATLRRLLRAVADLSALASPDAGFSLRVTEDGTLWLGGSCWDVELAPVSDPLAEKDADQPPHEQGWNVVGLNVNVRAVEPNVTGRPPKRVRMASSRVEQGLANVLQSRMQHAVAAALEGDSPDVLAVSAVRSTLDAFCATLALNVLESSAREARKAVKRTSAGLEVQIWHPGNDATAAAASALAAAARAGGANSVPAASDFHVLVYADAAASGASAASATSTTSTLKARLVRRTPHALVPPSLAMPGSASGTDPDAAFPPVDVAVRGLNPTALDWDALFDSARARSSAVILSRLRDALARAPGRLGFAARKSSVREATGLLELDLFAEGKLCVGVDASLGSLRFLAETRAPRWGSLGNVAQALQTFEARAKSVSADVGAVVNVVVELFTCAFAWDALSALDIFATDVLPDPALAADAASNPFTLYQPQGRFEGVSYFMSARFVDAFKAGDDFLPVKDRLARCVSYQYVAVER